MGGREASSVEEVWALTKWKDLSREKWVLEFMKVGMKKGPETLQLLSSLGSMWSK